VCYSDLILCLVILFIFWFVPFLIKKGSINRQSLPLIFFVVFAIISTLLAFFLDIPTFKNFSIIRNNIESIITLFIGITFFFISSGFPEDEAFLKRSLQIINWGGLIMLIWAGIQVISWVGFHKYFNWMFDFQGIFSSRVLYRNRVTGFALEPSWFSHQLNMLYIPLWLSASLKKFSSHDFKFLGFTFENLLLLGGVGALFFTLSRGGFLAFLLMMTLIFIYFNIQVINRIKDVWLKKASRLKKGFLHNSKTIIIFLSILVIFAYLILIAAGTFALSRIDPRMKDLFVFNKDKENPVLTYFNDLQFGERAVYWLAGWEIFGEHPIFGVGLGNAGFFFPQKITPYGWTLIEVRKLMYEDNVLLNIKSLWVRILAETGITGFSMFLSWIIVLIISFIGQLKKKNGMFSTLALAGIFIINALPAEGFSIDSFALPYLWVGLGLAVAGTRLAQTL
jgi:O-antigen ligase